MLLFEFVSAYLLERETCRKYAKSIRETVAHFESWLHHPATLADLTDDRVSRYLIDRGDGRSRWTIRGERARLLALWRAAWMADLVPLPPRRVRKVTIPRSAPRAWTLEEMRQLLSAANSVPGKFTRNSVPLVRAAYWRAVILVGYDTGLRLGDLERLRFDDVSRDGSIVVTQGKTGKVISRYLSDDALQSVRAISQPRRSLIFGGVLGRREYYRHFARLTDAAGLRGTTRWIRRTTGTLIDVETGRGHEALGNGRGVFDRHYRDPRAAGGKRLLPPSLAATP